MAGRRLLATGGCSRKRSLYRRSPSQLVVSCPVRTRLLSCRTSSRLPTLLLSVPFRKRRQSGHPAPKQRYGHMRHTGQQARATLSNPSLRHRVLGEKRFQILQLQKGIGAVDNMSQESQLLRYVRTILPDILSEMHIAPQRTPKVSSCRSLRRQRDENANPFHHPCGFSLHPPGARGSGLVRPHWPCGHLS